MMTFGAPQWLWLLIVAPLAAAISALCWRRRMRAAAAWAARSLWDRLLPTYRPWRLAALNTLLAIAIAGATLALAQPRWGMSERQIEHRGVDVVFVLDTSLSMATRDLEPSRLWVAQTLIRRLVQELAGHRVALVQAEGDGVVMVPLTTDSAVIDMLLDAIQPGSLPTPGTKLQPALERARSLFPAGDGKHRVLVLVSDGEDHGSELHKIAPKMRQEGTVVHTLGVGTLEGRPLELPRERRDAPVEYKRDEAGHVVVSRLMEATLEQLSRDTGGMYLPAASVAVDLSPIVNPITAMAKQSDGNDVTNTLGERFQWPAGLAIAALALHLLVSPFKQRDHRAQAQIQGQRPRRGVHMRYSG